MPTLRSSAALRALRLNSELSFSRPKDGWDSRPYLAFGLSGGGSNARAMNGHMYFG